MNRVVVTGMGAITPIGNNIETFWNNLVTGHCGIDFIKSIPSDGFPVKIAAEIKDFKPEEFGIDFGTVRRTDLFTQYALAAAYQAMQSCGDLGVAPERLGVYIGSGVGGIKTLTKEITKLNADGIQWVSPLFVPMMIVNIAAGNVAIKYNAQGPCLPIVTACATSTNSIGEAYRAIKHGYADAIIAGGAEAGLEPITVGGFANCKALLCSEDPKTASLPFDIRRQGFVIGEGAGIVVLEEYNHAKRRNANILAEVCGYGNTCDAYHVTAPKPDGSSAARSITMALDEAGFNSNNDLLYVNAHGTGTPLNDKSETAAIKLALGDTVAHKTLVSSNKSMIGHMLGAAGAVELIATVLSVNKGIIPPTIGLDEPDPCCDLDYVPNKAREFAASIAISNSLGFGGHNATVAVRKIV